MAGVPQRPHTQGISPASTLEEGELTLLGTCCWELFLRLDLRYVPPALKEELLFRDKRIQYSPDYLQLGTLVRDLFIKLGEDRYRLSLREGSLFWRAIAEAISQLHSQRLARVSLMRDGRQEGAPPLRVISMDELAQMTIDGAFSDGFSVPTPSERRTRVHCALALDPLCADAYLIQGHLEKRAGRFHRARIAYENAMRIAALKIGPEAIQSRDLRLERGIVFWADLSTRPYMRARSNLAYLYWHHLGELQQAIIHFQALLDLDPNDSQGNRYALMCCLLESGDNEQISALLARERLFTDSSGHTEDITETCWHYSRALQLYQSARQAPHDETRLQPATTALQTAFENNPLVPSHLLATGGIPRIPVHLEFVNSTSRETIRRKAVWYVDLARGTWNKIPGALGWLEAQAIQARLLL